MGERDTPRQRESAGETDERERERCTEKDRKNESHMALNTTAAAAACLSREATEGARARGRPNER